MRYVGRYLTTNKIWQVVTYTLKNLVTCCSDLRPDAVSFVNEEVFKNLSQYLTRMNVCMNEWMKQWTNEWGGQ